MKASAFVLLGIAAAADEPVRHYYTHLGDITPAESSVGWGSFQVNRNWYLDGFRINNQNYQTGVFAHAPSSLVYDLSSRFTKFTGFVGLDDGSAEHAAFQAVKDECKDAKVVATVYVDGVLTGEPMVLQRTAGKFIHPISVDVSKARELRLTAQLLNADSINCANNEGAEVAWVDTKLEEDPEIECVDLGEILPESTSVGWGSYWVNKNWYQTGFMINGVRYTTGVFAHAKSSIIYNLEDLTAGGDRVWSDFSFCVGLDDQKTSAECQDQDNGVHFNVNYQGVKNWNSKDTYPTGITRHQAAQCADVKLFDKDTGAKTDRLIISAYSATNPDGNDPCQEAEWVNARVCMDRSAKDCEVSSWTDYSTCDRTCGSGVQTRTRTVHKYPQFGGAVCPKLHDLIRCNEQACPIDCQYSTWSSYDDMACDKSCGTGHQYRYRGITRHASFGGQACPETSGSRTCNTHPCPVDCSWVSVEDNGEEGRALGWNKWSECTRTCGGGSEARFRYPDPNWTSANAYGGKACDVQAQAESRDCNSHCCPVDCVLSDYGAWSDCTQSCGTGFQNRKRTISTEVSCGGSACGVKMELKQCNEQPCPIDCVVSEWSAAHACSHSCGALGTQIRHRSIKIASGFGGVECPHISETSECGRDPCPVDCLVSQFGQWTTCSRSCGTGEHARRRTIRRDVAHGGKECPHQLEMRKCNKHDCPIDCEVSAWNVTTSDWSNQGYLDQNCDQTCGGGLSDRSRTVTRTHDMGGKSCGLIEMEQQKACNTQACPTDCVTSEWSEWTPCSVTCEGIAGKGKQYRVRAIVKASHFGGNGCPSLNENRFCPDIPLCPVDCDISAWSSWTSCSAECGSGYQRRTREVFTRMANGGLACPDTLEETDPCNEHACPVDCVLGEWVEGECDATCGAGVVISTRAIVTPSSDGGHECGVTSKSAPCISGTNTLCPIDCVYSEWGSFGQCSAACNDGITTPTEIRVRSIVVSGQNGGTVCDESTTNLRETNNCNEHKPCAVNCEVSDWADWAECSRSCGNGIQLRKRATVREAEGDGNSCPTTVDSRLCNSHDCPVDCIQTEFGTWSECTEECGQGFQYRSRITIQEATNGGVSCGTLQQDQFCNEQPCPVDCSYGEWSEYSDCSSSCGRGQKSRTRSTTAPLHGGKACDAAYELKECDNGQCPIHCQLQDWEAWGACSKTCGSSGNTQTRQRSVDVQAQFGGEACNEADKSETRICVDAPECPKSCKLDKWERGTCQASTDSKGACGEGTEVLTTSVLEFGESCSSDLGCTGTSVGSSCSHESTCDTGRKCEIDCVVSEFTAASVCTASCGGGSRLMARSIITAPQNGGQACPELKQTEDCNSQPCPIDCTYSEWSELSSCSVTCGPQYPDAGYESANGQMTRTRTVTQPQHGGAECTAAVETQTCNMGACPVDCTTSEWGEWGACSASCTTADQQYGGEKKRTRVISRHATLGGSECGDLEQTASCADNRCPVDCEVSAFGGFSTCSASCGGGVKIRHNTILVASAFGGRECQTGENVFCNTQSLICSNTVSCNNFDCEKEEIAGEVGQAGIDEAGLDNLPTIAPTKGASWEGSTTSKQFEQVGQVVAPVVQQSETEKGDITFTPTSTPTQAPTLKPEIIQTCKNGDWTVNVGWRGAGFGENFCNLCKCTASKEEESTEGILECQRKQCNVVTAGKVCTATTCQFVYSFDVQKEVMQVKHNTGNDVDGFKQEERNGSHHRCAYAVGNKIQSNVGSEASALEEDATETTNSGKNCICLCYGEDNYTQGSQPRLTSDLESDATKFGTDEQSANDLSAETNGADYLAGKETDTHDSGAHISTYYVDKWGETIEGTPK